MDCYILNIEAVGFMVSGIFFLCFIPVISLWKLTILRVWPIKIPGTWLAQFMEEATRHCFNVNIISCGPHGYRKEDFLSFSYNKSMQAIDPLGFASLHSRGSIQLIGRIYVGAMYLFAVKRQTDLKYHLPKIFYGHFGDIFFKF